MIATKLFSPSKEQRKEWRTTNASVYREPSGNATVITPVVSPISVIDYNDDDDDNDDDTATRRLSIGVIKLEPEDAVFRTVRVNLADYARSPCLWGPLYAISCRLSSRFDRRCPPFGCFAYFIIGGSPSMKQLREHSTKISSAIRESLQHVMYTCAPDVRITRITKLILKSAFFKRDFSVQWMPTPTPPPKLRRASRSIDRRGTDSSSCPHQPPA